MTTYKLIMAAAQDAGTKSMKSAGRKAWNEDDYNKAAEVARKLVDLI